MAEQFYTILTAIGKAKIANAAALGQKVELTELALGDGAGSYYNPTEDQTALRNEVWRGPVGSVSVDPSNPNWIVIQTVVPAQHGGFTIREAGVFDRDGDLIAVGKYPETYKPTAADGTIKDLTIRMILVVSNVSSVTIRVDPTVILATMADVEEAKRYTDQEVGKVDQKVNAHLNEDVTELQGVHGLRVQNGQIEYWDKEDQEWKRIAGGVEVPLGNVKNFTAKAGNGQVTLTWEDPDDVVVNDVVVSKWAGTKILRKVGSWPENENDGVLVVNNGVRNQYAVDGFVDSGLENDVTYYYLAVPYNTQGLHTVSESNRASATPREAKIYGLEWNQTLDTYQRLDDAEDMVAVTGGPNDFSSAYPWSEMKRCNLADDGTVTAYYGDPTYKDDGSNGQVMVQIPKFWYKSEVVIEEGEKKYRWWIADAPVEGFKLHPAFSRNGVEKDYIYIGAYEGYVSGGKLHSRAGVTPTIDRTIVQFRQDAQARGPIWHQQDFLTICAIQLLYLIEYAHFDSQTKIGRGITNDSNFHKTGETAQYGNESYGTVVNEATAMSYRGIENLYGNIWEWVDGININNHRAYIADSNFVSDKFDDHYRQVGFTNATSNGYVKDIGWTEEDDYMFLAIDATGSASSYLHDHYWQNTGARVACFGGDWGIGSNAGAFCWFLGHKSSDSLVDVGARLMCIP